MNTKNDKTTNHRLAAIAGTEDSLDDQEIVRTATACALALTSRQLTSDQLTARVATILGFPSSDITLPERLPMPQEQTDLDSAMIQADNEPYRYGRSVLYHDDCFDWLMDQPNKSIHAVVTDPPYGLEEYSQKEQAKLRAGRGGNWRLPPAYDGHQRSPVPRFTVLTESQLDKLHDFFFIWARYLRPKLRPGANVIVASNPLFSHIVSNAITRAGLEKRGEIIRLVMTMRGGDRPKGAETEFSEVTVMPRSMWEPWLIFRKPLEGTVRANLRKWETGGFRRPSDDNPFGDVIKSAPTNKRERNIAPHPSLKPQEFMRTIARAALPLGSGTLVDTFAGAGSTLAAAEVVGYASIGIERDSHYYDMAIKAIEPLTHLR